MKSYFPAAVVAIFLTGASVALAQEDPWANIYLDITIDGNTTGQWFEVPYTLPALPSLTLSDPNSAPETLSSVGYFISPTQIPLDQLNADLSDLSPLPQYDGNTIQPGNSETIVAPDQASTLALLAIPVTAFLVFRKRQRLHFR